MADVRLPDELLDRYKPYAKKIGVGVPALLAQVLARFADIAPHERIVILRGEARERVEHLLGHTSLQSGADVITGIERLADLQIGGIRLDLTPAEWEEITRRAEKHGITPEAMLREILASVHSLFFSAADPKAVVGVG